MTKDEGGTLDNAPAMVDDSHSYAFFVLCAKYFFISYLLTEPLKQYYAEHSNTQKRQFM
jgi:hypothetical protein